MSNQIGKIIWYLQTVQIPSPKVQATTAHGRCALFPPKLLIKFLMKQEESLVLSKYVHCALAVEAAIIFVYLHLAAMLSTVTYQTGHLDFVPSPQKLVIALDAICNVLSVSFPFWYALSHGQAPRSHCDTMHIRKLKDMVCD